jgi:hypothetical protein
LAAGSALYLTSGTAKVADAFMRQLQEGKVEEAYQSASPLFQQSVSKEKFKEFAAGIPWNEFEKATWSSRSVDFGSGVATLDGSAVFKGEPVIAHVSLSKVDGVWRVSGIKLGE